MGKPGSDPPGWIAVALQAGDGLNQTAVLIDAELGDVRPEDRTP